MGIRELTKERFRVLPNGTICLKRLTKPLKFPATDTFSKGDCEVSGDAASPPPLVLPTTRPSLLGTLEGADAALVCPSLEALRQAVVKPATAPPASRSSKQKKARFNSCRQPPIRSNSKGSSSTCREANSASTSSEAGSSPRVRVKELPTTDPRSVYRERPFSSNRRFRPLRTAPHAAAGMATAGSSHPKEFAIPEQPQGRLQPRKETEWRPSAWPGATPRVTQPFQLPTKFGLSPEEFRLPADCTLEPITPPTPRKPLPSDLPWLGDHDPARGSTSARVSSPKAKRRGRGSLVDSPPAAQTKALKETDAIELSAIMNSDDADKEVANMDKRTLGMVGSLQEWIINDKSEGKIGDVRDNVKSKTDGGTTDVQRPPGEMRYLLSVAKRCGMPSRDAYELYLDFRTQDVAHTGLITFEQFKDLVRKRAGVPANQSLPVHLLATMELLDANRDGYISMDEFVEWHTKMMWSEDLLMPDPDERYLRQLAREQGMVLLDVERVRKIFNEFDTDGSGEIEEEEFRHILYKMLKVKNPSDLPLKRLQHFWREVDSDGSGSIGFKEFLVWYRKCFMGP